MEAPQSAVLIVDDSADTREALRSLLEHKGYQVFTADDGQQALEVLHRGVEPGLILLDLMMPGMDGFRFRKEQLQDPDLSAIPVIVFSGHHKVADYADTLRAAACFQKPVDIDAFLSLVKRHCALPQRQSPQSQLG